MKLRYIAAAAVVAGIVIVALVMWCLYRSAAEAEREMEEMEGEEREKHD